MGFKILIYFIILLNLSYIIYTEPTLNSNDYDETNNTDDYIDDSSTSTHQTLSNSNDYYDNFDQDENLDGDGEEEDVSYLNDEINDKQPYECPSQCKCIFNKHDLSVDNEHTDSSNNSPDYYEDEINSERTNRKKRYISSTSMNQSVDYEEEDYVDEQTSSTNSNRLANKKAKAKYDIYIDCSNQNLNTISYLFSDDFPLDQIVSFNLSNNKFRLLKLDDGFEDLINIRTLDLSSNQGLKSISPKTFLKKFRHLEKVYFNNLNQINCENQKQNLNKLIPIDCKWLRTLLYLYKRNISVIIDRPFKCDLNKIVNNIPLMSRCFSDLYNSYRLTDSNQTQLQADNSKYEFRIEPELNQILIEGDTLELTCKLKKINMLSNKKKKNNQNFYKSQIKWYLNDNQQLMISTIYYSKENPTQIQIIENKSKFKQDDQIESKLIISNTISNQHTGRYSCVASLFLSDKKLSINTSRIEIKVLSRHQLNILETNEQNSILDSQKSKLYCPEIITQTYRGIYKWPRTLANSKITQKCYFSNTVSNSTQKDQTRNDFAIFECLPDGKWSDRMELNDCNFESNLTRYLNQLTSNSNSMISLEEFIKRIVSIQSYQDNSTSKITLNMYDILFIQKYLLFILNTNKTSYLSSSTWKHEFLFLNDMLSRLNEFYTKQAQLIDPELFSNYFFNSLLEIIISNFENESNNKTRNDFSNQLLSSYLATLSLGPEFNYKNRLTCNLEKYQLTQQIYFKCDEEINTSQTIQTRVDIEQSTDSKLKLIFFENDKLFPISLNETMSPMNLSNYELINLVDHNNLLESDELQGSNEKTCSQIIGLINNQTKQKLNLTLEIKIPDIYYRVLAVIRSKLINKTNELILERKMNKQTRRVEKEKNLFDYVFQLTKPIQTADLITTENNIQIVNKNLILKNTLKQEFFDLNSIFLKKFKTLLTDTWFNINSYQVHTGEILIYNQTISSSRRNQINWSAKSECKLVYLKTNFYENYSNLTEFVPIDLHFINKIRLFATLNCNIHPKNSIRLISLKHSIQKNPINSLNDSSLTSIVNMINQYAQLHRINLDEDVNTTKSIINRLNILLKENYEFFTFKIIYFSSVTSSIILLINIIIYIIFRHNLMMPRSFYHSLINIWISFLFFNLIYTLGVNQIYMPHLCLFTGIILHYLTLTTFVWYLLYFWCLFTKLNRLEKRNFNLIFNSNNKCDQLFKKTCSEYNGIDDETGEFIKRPVVHLYMLGWGVPLLLISIIVSITKRDYIQVPFSFCLTNEPNILIGSILVPIGVVGLVQLIFIVLILFTLRKILRDLKKDDSLEKNDIINANNNDKRDVKLDDKKELCKNWINSKLDDLKENELIEIKMNPQTQKSLIINASKFNNSNTSFDASNTSLANSDSDRTSIMDVQHKPQIQLKFSIFSWFLFVLIIIFSYLLADSNSNDLNSKLFSYFLTIFSLIYSILQLSFYVLSRDDIILLDLNFSFNFYKPSIISDEIDTNSNTNSNSNSNEPNNLINNETNWYFNPKSDNQYTDLPDHANHDLKEFKKETDDKTENQEESSDDNEYNNHKKSISDVIFSAKKLTPVSAKQVSPQSIESSSSSSAIISSETTSANMMNGIKSFKIDDDSKSDFTASHSLYPALAVPEDLSEYATPKMYNEQVNPNVKKPTHVRNPSLLSGSNTLHLINKNDNHGIYEKSLNKKSSYLNRQTKKPPYVFIDCEKNTLDNEDKIEIRQEEIIIQEYITNLSVNSAKNKLDDLLQNSCLSQTGTAIDCLVRVPKSNFNSQTNTNSTNSSNSLNMKTKTRRRSNDSASPSLASSSNDSNLVSNNQNQIVNNNNFIESVYEENPYGIYSSNLNRKNQINSPTGVQVIYSSNKLRSSVVRQTSTTLPSAARIVNNQSINSSTKINMTKTDSLLRNTLKCPKEFDIKHETSV